MNHMHQMSLSAGGRMPLPQLFIGDIMDAAFGSKTGGGGAQAGFNKKLRKKLGRELANKLLERLQTPITESEEFGYLSEDLSEQIMRGRARASHRLGEAAIGGGWMDSGSVLEGESELDRVESESISSGFRGLYMGLLDRQTAEVLPYLTGGSAAAATGAGIDLQGRGQDMNFISQMMGTAAQYYKT